jgi:hypothetical protein
MTQLEISLHFRGLISALPKWSLKPKDLCSATEKPVVARREKKWVA